MAITYSAPNLYLQYQQATNLQNLLIGFQPYVTISINDFYDNVFNILTCGTLGLDYWGLLLNTTRYVTIADYDYILAWGSDTLTLGTYPDYPQNFNNGNFYNGESEINRLNNEAYRQMLLLIYARNNCNMSLGASMIILNRYFYYVSTISSFTNNVSISEPSTMSMLFTFENTLQPYQFTIFTQENVLPVPTGVSYTFAYS